MQIKLSWINTFLKGAKCLAVLLQFGGTKGSLDIFGWKLSFILANTM